MTLAERLSEYVRAAFSGLYVCSHEHDDAIAEIARLCRDQGWSLATWDVDRGLALAGRAEATGVVPGAADPLAAIRSLGAMATPEGTAITWPCSLVGLTWVPLVWSLSSCTW